MWRKFIGDKHFYKRVLKIAVPIMIQNGITNFVGLLDNIMVGQVGTVQMSGVAIANTLIFVFNLCLFGAVSGAGIFTAQFFGSDNMEGVRNTFRFKILIGTILFVLVAVLFIVFGEPLINLYLQGDGSAEDIRNTLIYGRSYMLIMLVGLAPYTLSQSYASTLRETGETFVPMLSSSIAVFVNLIGNYVLIFGHFGAPRLGVAGAAVATVISRFVEVIIIMTWTHRHVERNRFVVDLYKTLLIPNELAKQIIIKGFPLIINETLWAAGLAMVIQCYSFRGYDVVAAQNICQTIANLFNVIFIALGDSVAIIVGQLLGANKFKEAVEEDTKLLFFSVGICFFIGGFMAIISPLIPEIYNTTASIKQLAGTLVMIEALFMPVHSFIHSGYFTLRSGGKTIITFLFDSGFVWVVMIPFAFCVSRFTDIPIVPLYALVKSLDIIKCIVGFVLIKKKVWVQNFVAEI